MLSDTCASYILLYWLLSTLCYSRWTGRRRRKEGKRGKDISGISGRFTGSYDQHGRRAR